MTPKQESHDGFTLIELSIVLVVIGLIVGGVLVGRDLISAAEIRKQITQIERFKLAASTFQGKYGGLPGDLEQSAASQFGFITRGIYQGQGDGNGLMEGVSSSQANRNGGGYLSAENAVFWVDLTSAGLIEDKLVLATPSNSISYSSGAVPRFHPVAKLGPIGANPSVYVHSAGGKNYFGLSGIGHTTAGVPTLTNILTVAQAKAIDSKLDDGKAWTGNVLTLQRYASEIFASGGGDTYIMSSSGDISGAYPVIDLNTDYTFSALPQTENSCFDNANQTLATPDYTPTSISILPACSLSFSMR